MKIVVGGQIQWSEWAIEENGLAASEYRMLTSWTFVGPAFVSLKRQA